MSELIKYLDYLKKDYKRKLEQKNSVDKLIAKVQGIIDNISENINLVNEDDLRVIFEKVEKLDTDEIIAKLRNVKRISIYFNDERFNTQPQIIAAKKWLSETKILLNSYINALNIMVTKNNLDRLEMYQHQIDLVERIIRQDVISSSELKLFYDLLMAENESHFETNEIIMSVFNYLNTLLSKGLNLEENITIVKVLKNTNPEVVDTLNSSEEVTPSISGNENIQEEVVDEVQTSEVNASNVMMDSDNANIFENTNPEVVDTLNSSEEVAPSISGNENIQEEVVDEVQTSEVNASNVMMDSDNADIFENTNPEVVDTLNSSEEVTPSISGNENIQEEVIDEVQTSEVNASNVMMDSDNANIFENTNPEVVDTLNSSEEVAPSISGNENIQEEVVDEVQTSEVNASNVMMDSDNANIFENTNPEVVDTLNSSEEVAPSISGNENIQEGVVDVKEIFSEEELTKINEYRDRIKVILKLAMIYNLTIPTISDLVKCIENNVELSSEFINSVSDIVGVDLTLDNVKLLDKFNDILEINDDHKNEIFGDEIKEILNKFNEIFRNDNKVEEEDLVKKIDNPQSLVVFLTNEESSRMTSYVEDDFDREIKKCDRRKTKTAVKKIITHFYTNSIDVRYDSEKKFFGDTRIKVLHSSPERDIRCYYGVLPVSETVKNYLCENYNIKDEFIKDFRVYLYVGFGHIGNHEMSYADEYYNRCNLSLNVMQVKGLINLFSKSELTNDDKMHINNLIDCSLEIAKKLNNIDNNERKKRYE